MHKLMCTFATPMKKKIPDRNLDTSCPAGIPCNNKYLNRLRNSDSVAKNILRLASATFQLRIFRHWKTKFFRLVRSKYFIKKCEKKKVS